MWRFVICTVAAVAAAPVTASPTQETAYSRQVQPFLKQHGITCHG